MKIALPLTTTDTFAVHYGQAAKFRVFDLDTEHRLVRRSLVVVPQASRPCHWPPLLRAAGVTVFITGGIGTRARQALQRKHVEVVTGVTPAAPESLVGHWMAGTLKHDNEPCSCNDPHDQLEEGFDHPHAHHHHCTH